MVSAVHYTGVYYVHYAADALSRVLTQRVAIIYRRRVRYRCGERALLLRHDGQTDAIRLNK